MAGHTRDSRLAEWADLVGASLPEAIRGEPDADSGFDAETVRTDADSGDAADRPN